MISGYENLLKNTNTENSKRKLVDYLVGQIDTLKKRVTSLEETCGTRFTNGSTESDTSDKLVEMSSFPNKGLHTHEFEYGRASIQPGHIDLFQLICAKMPINNKVVKYLFKKPYNGGTILVDFMHQLRLTRDALRSLLPRQWIVGEVIDCLAFYRWRETFYDEKKRNIWNLPAYFSDMASSDGISDNTIDSVIFGEQNHYKALPRDCHKINIPINDSNSHWYLCTIDFQRKTISISDTYRSVERDAKRKETAKDVVIRLERIAKLWDRDQYFMQRDWAATFIWEESCVPRQNDSHSCGLYVLLQMMFPEAALRLLTAMESIDVRKCFATLLFTCEMNKATRGMEIVYVIHSKGAEICFESIDSLGMNLQQTITYITRNLDIFPAFDEEPELRGRLPRGNDFIPIRSDDELMSFLKNYTDLGIEMVNVEVVLLNI